MVPVDTFRNLAKAYLELGTNVAGVAALGPLWPLLKPIMDRLLSKIGDLRSNDERLAAIVAEFEKDESAQHDFSVVLRETLRPMFDSTEDAISDSSWQIAAVVAKNSERTTEEVRKLARTIEAGGPTRGLQTEKLRKAVREELTDFYDAELTRVRNETGERICRLRALEAYEALQRWPGELQQQMDAGAKVVNSDPTLRYLARLGDSIREMGRADLELAVSSLRSRTEQYIGLLNKGARKEISVDEINRFYRKQILEWFVANITRALEPAALGAQQRVNERT